MKKIITIISILISIFTNAQTKLDTLIFNKVNEYRASRGLTQIKWDANSIKAAEKHSSYLLLKNKQIWPNILSSHEEDTLLRPSDRYRLFSGDIRFNIGEVVIVGGLNYREDDSLKYDKIATEVVNGWKSSTYHNEILISDYLFGGVSCKFFTKPQGLRGWNSYTIIATMVFVTLY